MPKPKPINKLLRAIREQRGLSVNELARSASVHRAILFRAESGTTKPSTDTLHRLGKFYGLTIEQMRGEE
jgi:transcriptional regulator with XRE-family HTH domain